MATDQAYKEKRKQRMANPAPLPKPGVRSPLLKHSPAHGAQARARAGISETAYNSGALSKNVYSDEERSFMKETGFDARGGGPIAGGRQDIGGKLAKNKRLQYEHDQAFIKSRGDIASDLGLETRAGKAALKNLMQERDAWRTGQQERAGAIDLAETRSKSALDLGLQNRETELASEKLRAEGNLATTKMRGELDIKRQEMSDKAAMSRQDDTQAAMTEKDAATRKQYEEFQATLTDAGGNWNDPAVVSQAAALGVRRPEKEGQEKQLTFVEFMDTAAQAGTKYKSIDEAYTAFQQLGGLSAAGAPDWNMGTVDPGGQVGGVSENTLPIVEGAVPKKKTKKRQPVPLTAEELNTNPGGFFGQVALDSIKRPTQPTARANRGLTVGQQARETISRFNRAKRMR